MGHSAHIVVRALASVTTPPPPMRLPLLSLAGGDVHLPPPAAHSCTMNPSAVLHGCLRDRGLHRQLRSLSHATPVAASRRHAQNPSWRYSATVPLVVRAAWTDQWTVSKVGGWRQSGGAEQAGCRGRCCWCRRGLRVGAAQVSGLWLCDGGDSA